MANLERQIARSIVLAQVASDGGKDIDDIRYIIKGASRVWDRGYSAKDELIVGAITMIRKSRNSTFRYYVTECNDYGKQALVYFDFKIDGRRFQVSFHTYSKEIIKMISKRRYETHWDRRSSRGACEELVKHYELY